MITGFTAAVWRENWDNLKIIKGEDRGLERVTWGHSYQSAQEGSTLPQILLPYSVTKAFSNKYIENYATINSILTAAESIIHSVLSLAGIFTLILWFLHYAWIHVRFHFAMGDWTKKKKNSSESPGLLCLTLCQMTGKTLSRWLIRSSPHLITCYNDYPRHLTILTKK